MTVAPTTPGGLPANWNEDEFADFGMEDIDSSELSLPRLEIVHEEGRFRDRNSQQEFERLQAVILGVVKGRIMWDRVMDDNDRPQCRSNDFRTGFPQMRTDIPQSKQFPWDKSNFAPTAFPPGPDGQIRLPCAQCHFKDWDHNGFGQKKPPCSETFHLAMMYDDGSGVFSPAILTLKSSAVPSVRKYITPFKAQKQPMFTALTEMTLNIERKGGANGKKYSVPTFKRIGQSNPANWQEYMGSFRSIRDFLQREPRPDDKAPKPVASSRAATQLDENDPWNQQQAANQWPAAQPNPADAWPTNPQPQAATPPPAPAPAPVAPPAAAPVPPPVPVAAPQPPAQPNRDLPF